MPTRRKKKAPPREAVHLYLRGKSYYFEFVWKGVRYGPKSLGPVSREVAERQVAEMRLAVIEGSYHPRAPISFDAFAVEFLAWYRPGHRPRSTARYLAILSRYVTLWGALPLPQLTTVMIEGFKRDRASVVQPRTVNLELRVLKHLCATAVTWGHLDRDPSKAVAPVLTTEPRRRVISRAEEALLLEACGPRLRPVVIVGVETGLRRSELVALCWRHVDLLARTIWVEHAKSRKSRTVPLTSRAVETLMALPQGESDTRVFGYRNFDEVLTMAVQRAGLKGITPHAMRHSYATRCLEAGVDLIVLQKWLGHHSVVQTQQYVHPSSAHEREAIARLERLREKEA